MTAASLNNQHNPENQRNRQERDYFLKLFNGIADAVLISERRADGLPGSFVEVNEVATNLLGYDRQQLMTLGPLDICRMALDEKDGYKPIVTAIEQSGKSLFRTEFKHRDGYWVPVEISSQLFELAGREVFFSVARDITLRERYEATIKTLVRSTVGLTGQECLEEITRNLCDWLDVEGSCIALFSDNQVAIKSCFFQGEYRTLSNIPVANSPFADIKEGNFTIYSRHAGVHFAGATDKNLARAESFIGCPLQGHEGHIIGTVYAYSSRPLQAVPHVEELLAVIAARAAAECERMHYVRELSHREEMLRTLFQSTAEAIVGIDMNGLIDFCNHSAVKILGYHKDSELIGHSFRQRVEESPLAEEVPIEDVCPYIYAVIKRGTITSEEGFFSHNNGYRIPVEYWCHKMCRDNQMIGAVITFIDISKRKTLEQQLQHSQRMEAIGTLTGGIAHDFNNILTVISGYVGLLKTQTKGNEKLNTRIMKIGEAAERGSKLTHGLLAYSRKKSEPSTPVDLNQLVLNVRDIFGTAIGEGISTHLTLANENMVVLADSSQMEQVLVNLVTNARDAMKGDGTLSIKTERAEIDTNFFRTFGYGEPGPYVLITVKDTGVGIPEEIQQKIFDPFFTTKDTGKGTGLGLAMVWGIVKQHKGYIHVDSTLGEGSEFRIYLPWSDQPLPIIFGSSGNDLPGGDETILLVEDDLLVRETTESILSAVGYEVVGADCAESALTLLDNNAKPFDMILSDVVMPGLKCSDFYREIIKRTDAPVIFISGYTFDALRDQGLVKEEVTLLNKPIEPHELLTEIRQKLNKLKFQ